MIYVPFLSLGIDYGLGKAIEIRQKKKLEMLFEIILEDGTITMDDINDVDCIKNKERDVDERYAGSGTRN